MYITIPSKLCKYKYVDINTPHCVLIEILDSYRVRRQDYHKDTPSITRMIELIIRQPDIIINRLDDVFELRIMASFMNSSVQKWSSDNLLKTLAFNIQLDKDDLIKRLCRWNDLEWNMVGLPTNERIEMIFPSRLYLMLKQNKINTYYTMTLDELISSSYMFIKLINLKVDPVTAGFLINMYNQKGSLLTGIEMGIQKYSIGFFPDCMAINGTFINKYPSMNLCIDVKTIYNTRLDVQTRHLSTLDSPIIGYIVEGLNRYTPKNIPFNIITKPEEAIVAMAHVYNLDISQASNPLSEWKNFQREIRSQSTINRSTNFCNLYKNVCRDEWIRLRLQSNHALDSIDLMVRYNPLLHPSMYSESLVDIWSSRIGQNPWENLHEIISVKSLTNQFYVGKPLIYENSNTPIYDEEVSELEFHQCISFGTMDIQYVTSIGELLDLFKSEYRLVYPFLSKKSDIDQNLDSHQVLSLITALESYPEGSNSPDITSLIELINSIKSLNDLSNEQIKTLVHHYRTNEAVQSIIKTFINITLELAMFMRGWIPGNEYPIITAPYTDSSVYIRVTDQIMVWKQFIDKYSIVSGTDEIFFIKDVPLGLFLSQLNLIDYRGNYTVLNDISEGPTIGDRINIVSEGNHLNSCIRITSNKLCYTVHYLSKWLGLPLPFDIESLNRIV